jgi:hypothetical protein
MFVVVLLSVCMTGMGCKGDGEGGGGGAPASKGGPSAAASSAPDKAAVDALDCNKACTQDGECIQKSGIKLHETHQRDCTQSCEMLKGMYDPAKHGKAMARMISRAEGKCAD